MQTVTVQRPPAFMLRARVVGRHLSHIGLAIGGIALVVLVWHLIALSVGNPTLAPEPADVLQAVRDNWQSIPSVEYVLFEPLGIRDALAHTVWNVVFAVAVGLVIGLPLGIMLARLRTFGLLMEPPLLVLGTVPLLIVLPFVTLWFGTARFAQSVLVILFTLLTVSFAAQSAATTVSERYSHFAACLGASQFRILRTIVLPAAIPSVLGAVRVALAAGWGWQAVAELLGGREGVGRVIYITARSQATTDLFSMLLGLVVAALVIDAIVTVVGGFIIRWKE